MLEYVFLALIGCALGIVTGLIPGLHVNTVAVIGLGTYVALGLNPLGFVVILTALSITHAFLDYIPSIFLGAPQEETALSVLPAHRMFMQGKALEAVKLTATGSLLGLTMGLILFLPALYVIPWLYNASRGIIAYVLIVLVLLLLLHEKTRKKIAWSVLVFLLAGWLGVVALDMQKILSSNEILFPVFAGLFGMANLIDSLKSKVQSVPQDEYVKVGIEPKFMGAGLMGALSGAIIGVLPAISPSQLGALLSERFELDSRNFLVFLSAINTSDAIYSLLAIYTIQNPRSGVAVIVQKVLEIDYDTVLLLVGVMAFSAVFATIAHIEIGKRMSRIVSKINYKKLCLASLMLILSLVYLFTGVFGLLIALLCTVIGLLPILAGISRTHLMGVLLVPTILFFLGVQL
jgi:putative membrane protein